MFAGYEGSWVAICEVNDVAEYPYCLVSHYSDTDEYYVISRNKSLSDSKNEFNHWMSIRHSSRRFSVGSIRRWANQIKEEQIVNVLAEYLHRHYAGELRMSNNN